MSPSPLGSPEVISAHSPSFPYPRLSHRTAGPPKSMDAARPPHRATEPSGCFSLLPSAPVTRPLGDFRRTATQ